MAEFTPMMRQYFEIKEQYKDCILMYRLGDFYEMFFEDALTASKVLEITLTGRDCGREERAPMCGVPFHAVDSYISKLVTAGYNVAICEQTEDPSKVKAGHIVKREVIRVVTPGTIIDTSALEETKNNYICAVCKNGRRIGIAFADVTTGEIFVNDFSGSDCEIQLLNEISRFNPAEVIENLEMYENEAFTEMLKNRFGCSVRNFYNWAFEPENAQRKVDESFGESYAEKIGCGEIAEAGLGALLVFLEETQKTELKNLRSVEVIDKQEYMGIDLYSIRNLELLETVRDKKAKGSLLSVLDKTETSMGGRLMRKWITMPLVNCAKIQNRHKAVGELKAEPIMREDLIGKLKQIQDIERMMGKVAYKTANCKELIAIARSAEQFPYIKKVLEGAESGVLRRLAREIDGLEDVRDMIAESINENAPLSLREGDIIRDGYSEEIDKYRAVMKNGVKWINDFAEQEKEKTGIKAIKVGYNRVFGYFLEISKANTAEVPEYFVRKQTLSNCERYITPQIKEVEESITEAESKIVALEYDTFCRIRDAVAEQMPRIQTTAHAIATLDVLCSLAAVAEKNRYVMPTVNMSGDINIKDGRHPVVEKIKGAPVFIPNDTELDCAEKQIAIITGPNMAGKSTYMRQTALIVIMAQMGSFVPAASAEIGIVDNIFTRVGASDDLSAGQSTFMVEMSEVAHILDNATDRSLILLDEIGRGTSTFDGLSIAWAVVEHIADKRKCGAKTLFATHYHELTELEETVPNVKNYCIAVKKRGDDITFLRKIIRGGADGSYGIEVAALAGVKKDVTRRAKEILAGLEERDGAARTPKMGGIHAERAAGDEEQLSIIGMEENEVLSELRALDPDSLSPMEALTKLYALKAKAQQM